MTHISYIDISVRIPVAALPDVLGHIRNSESTSPAQIVAAQLPALVYGECNCEAVVQGIIDVLVAGDLVPAETPVEGEG